MTKEKIKNLGYRVSVSYLRHYSTEKWTEDSSGLCHFTKSATSSPLAKSKAFQLGFDPVKDVELFGGAVVVKARTKDNREIVETVYCNRTDAFNKKIGKNIALGRLYKKLCSQL